MSACVNRRRNFQIRWKKGQISTMKYIAALDVGTTTVRFHILDEKAVTVASSAEKVCRDLIFMFFKDRLQMSI